MAYTQAPIDCKIYMTLPHGISTWHGSAKNYVLKLINNIYEQKQAGKVFADYMSKTLQEINFKHLVSNVWKVIFVEYVDDGIFLSPPHT